MWTPERIESLLNSSDLAVERSIVVLYDRQTNDEKRDSDTKHTNKRGFRANHAAKMSYFARIILKGWKQDRNKNRVHSSTPASSARRRTRRRARVPHDPRERRSNVKKTYVKTRRQTSLATTRCPPRWD